MPRAFKLYIVMLALWASWAVGRINETHARIPADERHAIASWQTLAP